MASEPDPRPVSNRTYITFTILSLYLIVIFLWRLLVPVHELPLRSEQVLTAVLDLLVIAGLVGLKLQLPDGKVLFGIALIAGIGLFAIRLTSDDAWWSGHLVFYLAPR